MVLHQLRIDPRSPGTNEKEEVKALEKLGGSFKDILKWKRKPKDTAQDPPKVAPPKEVKTDLVHNLKKTGQVQVQVDRPSTLANMLHSLRSMMQRAPPKAVPKGDAKPEVQRADAEPERRHQEAEVQVPSVTDDAASLAKAQETIKELRRSSRLHDKYMVDQLIRQKKVETRSAAIRKKAAENVAAAAVREGRPQRVRKAPVRLDL